MVISSSNHCGIDTPGVMSNNYLIENELGYTNHSNGKYVTEENATHIATIEDGQTVIIVYEREYLEGLDLDKLVNPT